MGTNRAIKSITMGYNVNRAKGQLDKSLNKKRDKTIKYAQSAYFTPEKLPNPGSLTAKDLLKKQPKKLAKKEQEELNGSMKRMEIKKTKEHSPHSKRTTPGQVDERPSPPASIHPEGRRWQKTLTLQSKIQRKSLDKKLSKKR